MDKRKAKIELFVREGQLQSMNNSIEKIRQLKLRINFLKKVIKK